MLLIPSKKNCLEVNWEGPADVMQKLFETNYVIRMPGRRKELNIHHTNLMKPYRQCDVVVNMTLNTLEETDPEMPILGQTGGEIAVDNMMHEVMTTGNLQPDQVNELNSSKSFQVYFPKHRAGRHSSLTTLSYA